MGKAAVSKAVEKTAEERLMAFFHGEYCGRVEVGAESNSWAPCGWWQRHWGLVCGHFQSDSSFGPWDTDYTSVVLVCFVSCSHTLSSSLRVHGDTVTLRSWHLASLSGGYFHSLEA